MAVASPVRSNHVESGVGDRQHHFSPAVRELRKSVQEYDAGTSIGLEACLQDKHRDAVDICNKSGSYARWEELRNCTVLLQCPSVLPSDRGLTALARMDPFQRARSALLYLLV